MDRRYPSSPALFSPGVPRGDRNGSTATPNSSWKRRCASAASSARSRRNGWLARLIGIFISIVLRDGPQIPQQPRVILSGRAQGRPQRLHRHTQFFLEAPLRLGGQQRPVAPERLAGEIDRNLHFNCSSRWTADTPAAPRYSLRACPGETATAPPPHPILPGSAAAPRRPAAPGRAGTAGWRD